MKWKRRRAVEAVVLVAGLGVGCASGADPAGNGSVISTAPSMALASTAGPELRMVWRNPELHPIDQPVAIGGIVVAVVADREELFVVGIDPATGAKRWQQAMTPSSVPAGERIRVTPVGDDKVAYFRPANRGSLYPYAELVIADVRTGRELAKSVAALFTSLPVVCSQGAAVCVTSEGWNADRREHGRLEISTGAYVTDNRNIPLRAHVLAESGLELLELGDYPDNTMGVLRDGRLQWHLRYSAAFPRGFSTQQGGIWHLYAEPRVLVGSIFGGHWDSRWRWIHKLETDNATVGLSEATGQVLWRDRGSEFRCGIGNGDHPVRCRSRGTVSFPPEGPASVDDLAVTVEGFDPATGKTTWSVAMGHAADLASGESYPAIAGASKVAIARPERWMVLDYATGVAAPAAPEATFWCMARARYKYPALFSRGRSRGPDHRPGGRLAFICDGRGQPAAALPDADATLAAGARVDRHAVLATRDGLFGFERQAPSSTEDLPPSQDR